MTNNYIQTAWILTALITLMGMLPIESFSQEMYATSAGKIELRGIANDQLIVAQSDQVHIIVDYETASFTLRFDKSTLRTGIDSIDAEIARLKYLDIVYKGKMKIGEFEGAEYIPDEGQPKIDFRVEGFLTLNQQLNTVAGEGEIEHLFGMNTNCLLTMEFKISLKELGIKLDIDGLDDEITVNVYQARLNRRS